MVSTRTGEPRKRRYGFSLVETTVSVLIVGLMIVPALNTAGRVAQSYAARADHDVATALANDLMGEILQSYFEDPNEVLCTFGPESDEGIGNRSDFDDVDDYHGWVESTPQEKDGTPLPGADVYERRVTIEYVETHAPTQTSATPTRLKRVTVETVRSTAIVARVVALRASSGVYETKPQAEQTFVRWIGLLVQVGSHAAPINDGIHIVNQVPVE